MTRIHYPTLLAVFTLLTVTPRGAQPAAGPPELYLLGACPGHESNVRAPAILYRMEKSARDLEAIRVVYDPGPGPRNVGGSVDFVVADSDLRIMAVGVPAPAPDHCEFIRMDAPWARDPFDLSGGGSAMLLRPPLFSPAEAGKLLLLFNWVANPPLTETLLAINVASKQKEVRTWQAYQGAHITGGTSGYEFTDDSKYLQQWENGRLVMPLGGYAVEVPPPLPLGLRFEEEAVPELVLNNGFMLAAIPGAPEPQSTSGLGKLTYRVYDRAGGAWKTLTVPGNLSRNVRAFGPWISGMVDEDASKHVNAGVRTNLSPPRVSPGRTERPQEWRATGRPIDSWLEGFYYRPGILFLYHVPSGRYIQWDTRQGDSEILLVENGEVYYRVNRSIYRATIGENAIGKPTPIVEADEVPDIHWVFHGPPVPADYKLPPPTVLWWRK